MTFCNLNFFQNSVSKKVLSGIPSECQTQGFYLSRSRSNLIANNKSHPGQEDKRYFYRLTQFHSILKDNPYCMFGRVQLHLWKGLPKVATIMLIWQNFMDLTLGKLVLIDKYFP